MEEKKKIKINLGTAICIFIIIILVIALEILYLKVEELSKAQVATCTDSILRDANISTEKIITEETNNKVYENNSINNAQETNNKVYENNSINNTQETDEEIVKELFIKNYLKPWINDNSNDSIAIVDYRIDKIEVISGSKKDGIKAMLDDITDNVILAYVNYSVKPKNLNAYIVAGNGKVSDEWDINKTQCVRIDKVDGEYKFISGTGW